MDRNELIKQREIRFCSLHPDPLQAESASQVLAPLDGVFEAQPVSGLVLRVSYDLTLVSLKHLCALLEQSGFHLDNSLLPKLMNALYFYTEETERANLGLASDNATVKLFIDHYQRRRHGCRDTRPSHWRNYR